MPFQNQPFNGDTFIQQEFLKLRDKYDLVNAVETGTCMGSTTLWLSDNFKNVYTVEVNPEFMRIAADKFKERENILPVIGNSPSVISRLFSKVIGNRTIFFLDAHWTNNCPLLAELKAIANAGLRPIIAIHDFKVPGSSLGFDSYNNQPFTLDWIKPALAEIYNEADSDVDDYTYYYNSDETATGAKRGIIYILPL